MYLYNRFCNIFNFDDAEPEFKKWQKTKRFTDTIMTVTQKLDGTNSQIFFKKSGKKLIVRAGSRNKWLDTNKKRDNFGFGAFVQENKDVLFEILGEGRHFGEWCGKGIQTGEGLDTRRLYMFDSMLDIPNEHRDIISTVPLVYKGEFSQAYLIRILQTLKDKGSFLNGFKDPEGIIINFCGVRRKLYVRQLDLIKSREHLPTLLMENTKYED